MRKRERFNSATGSFESMEVRQFFDVSGPVVQAVDQVNRKSRITVEVIAEIALAVLLDTLQNLPSGATVADLRSHLEGQVAKALMLEDM